MDKIHWLHLSDIHLNKRDVDSRRMRNRLLDYVKELGTQIDYIFITGDLRYAPMGEFAADTVDYINKLLNVTNLTVDRLFIVPGNHDIERDAEGRAEAILESIKDYSPKDGALASDKMAAVHCGHTEFRKMMHTIYHENQEQAASYDDDEKPHFVTETKDFNIICIDTALTYTKQRNNNLFIGTEYIMDLLEELNQDKPSIILTHYSFDFLERSEQMQIVQLLKDFHVQLWLAGHEHPDLITINRFRNRVKEEINHVFTQLVLVLADKGFISLDVEYIDGSKIESKANKYTFIWRKSVEKHRAKLLDKIRILLEQVDETIAQENSVKDTPVEFTPAVLSGIVNELKEVLEHQPVTKDKDQKKALREKKKQPRELEGYRDKLMEYDSHLDTLGERNSYSKTDPDATFMRVKEDAMKNGQTKPGYNLQIGTENQFIIDFSLFPNPTDTLTLIPFFHSFQNRYNRLPNIGVADSGYGSEENYRFMQERGIEAFVKYNFFHKEQRPRYTPNPFHAESLYYNAEEDYYVCSMGQRMNRIGTKHDKTASGYITESARYKAQRCQGCPLRGSCFKARGNRVIEVNYRLNQYKQQARERLLSEEGIRHRGRGV